MRFEYLIGLRYLRARRKERFVSLIALISLVGVTLGTFVLSLTLSIMSGLQEDLRARLLAFTPHITVERTSAGAWQPDTLQRRISSIPGVAAAAPFVSAQVLAVSGGSDSTPGYVAGGTLRAVVAHDNPVLTQLKESMTAGSLDALGSTIDVSLQEAGARRTVKLPGAVIGKSLADDLGLRPGDPVTLVAPATLGSGTMPRLRRFAVGGFFHSGMPEYDSALVFVALPDGRALLGDTPEQEAGLEVRVEHLFDAPAIAARIRETLGASFEVKDWTETNASLFSALQLEKTTYFVVLLLIVLVAAFNIVATLVMVVMERRKEIAILQAMGARAGSIAAIFLVEGGLLGIVGTVIGVGAGYVTSFLIGKYHLIALPSDVFIVSWLPVRLYPSNFLLIATAAVVLCIGAALYPALQASSLRPVEVIRYE